jgi:hypothetical protein
MARTDYTRQLATAYSALRGSENDPAVFDAEFTALTSSIAAKVDVGDTATQTLLGALVVPAGATGAQVPQLQEVQTLVTDQAFPVGTKLVFHQAAAPTGWEQDTTVQDGSMMRMVSGTGAGFGGTHDANVGVSASATGAHAITVAQMPAHAHSYERAALDSSLSGLGSSTNKGVAYTTVNTSSKGSGATHTHPLTISWVPKYSNVIVCTRL